jgi:YebC/PmpR family DNA-binding regulatory protein
MGRAFEVRKASMMKTGMAKTKLYSRYSKEIYLAAKSGGADVEANLTLKRLMEKAKKDQVPADVIKRAVDKVNSGQGEDYKENRYEGFGPNGATIIVDCLTDNANRTISEVKNCFTKSENKLGVTGSVAHMYEFVGILSIKNIDEDAAMELCIDNDVDAKDIEAEEDQVAITIDVTEFNKLRQAIVAAYGEEAIGMDELTMLPGGYVNLDGEAKESFEKLLNMLNECDDVQNVYHNVENM